MSTDLIAELRAALDERERLAKDAAAHCGSLIAREARQDDCYEHEPPYDGAAWSSDWDHVYAEDSRPMQPKRVPIADFGHSAWGLTGHIQANSPAFVLADIAAKRKLIDLHAEFDFPHNPDDGPGDYAWTARCDGCHEPAPCTTVRLLAEAYGIRA